MKRSLLITIVLLPAAAFLLYRKAARLWWTYDAPMLLHRAISRDWTYEYLTADTQQFLFTPLLSSTYESWLAAFGLEARWWYLAQIALIAVTAIALFAALRLYVDRRAAAGGAILFLLGPPVAGAAATLYLIHYFEAVLFCTLAAILFILAVRRDRITLSIAAALCYAIAMCAKEIAAPLPAVLLVLPEGNPRTRIKHLIAPAIAAAAYAIWRIFVIRLPLSGYGWATAWSDVATLPWRLIAAAAGASLVAGLIAIAVMLAGAAPALRTRRAIVLAAVALFCAVAPIAPVSAEMQDRFALAFWVWLCCVFAIGVRRPIVIAAAIAVALVANRQEWASELTRNRRMSEEARVWVHERGDVLLRNPAIPPGTMPELQWLKEEHLGHARGARWFYDDFFLCAQPVQNRRILEYDPHTRSVGEVDARCVPGREHAPLTADFAYHGGVLQWRFGPYRDGTWRMLLADGALAWEFPREGRYRLGGMQQLTLRVAYRSPEGWVTVSPPIALDFARQPRTTWRR